MSKVHARSHEIAISHYEFVLQKHHDYRLEKQTIMLRSVPQLLKKMKNRRKQNFEGGANNMQLDKEETHVLDEATRIVNVFLIS